MDNIITAIYEEKILRKIIKNKLIKNENILYKEAIIDIVKKNKKIDILIISEKIPGDIDIIKLIKKIKNINKKIEIIIILSNKKNEKELIKNNIKEIYFNNIFSINKLIKKIKDKNIKNTKINNNIINKKIKKIVEKIYRLINKNKKEKIIDKKIIFIFGEDKINKKIIELFIIKKIILKNKKITIINLKLKNNKNIEYKKIIKLKNMNSIKNKYYLKYNIDYRLKEKKVDRNVKEIININKILEDKNELIKSQIIREIVKKNSKKGRYIIFNVDYVNNYKLIKRSKLQNKNLNIIVAENKKEDLLMLNKNTNKKFNLIILNCQKNNLSKYFYKIILKNKFNKIKIIN